jgi:hypothetical protein
VFGCEADGAAVCDGEVLGLGACEGEGCNIVHVINSPHYIEECQGFRVVLLTLCLTFSHTETLVSVTLFFFSFYFLPDCHSFSYDYCVPFTISFSSYLFPLNMYSFPCASSYLSISFFSISVSFVTGKGTVVLLM